MIFRIWYDLKGGAHVHCRMFSGPKEGALGKCGDLVMREAEFEVFKAATPSIDFRAETPSSIHPVEPHEYSPSAMHQGDCSVCGHVADSPLHHSIARQRVLIPDSTIGWPENGDRMRFLNANGHEFEREAAAKLFKVGEVYIVESCRVGGWSSAIKFKGIDGMHNSVMFSFLEPPPKGRIPPPLSHSR